MPTYEYECEKCHRVFELRQRISEPALTTHDACGGAVKRLLSPAPFILKGEGWYVTDYPSEARKKAKEAETPKSDSSKSDSSKSDGAKADTAKTETTKSAEPSSSTGAAAPSAPAKSD